jgi:hypothetical protein
VPFHLPRIKQVPTINQNRVRHHFAAAQSEREAIWKVQIAKYHRDPKDFDIVQLAKATEVLTGSEIEALFIDSLFQAFGDDKEPTDLAIALALIDFVPLSKTMAEQIVGLRS